MSRLPIRLRLTLVFAIVMALVLAALGAALYVRLGSSLDERIADSLESRSGALATVVRTNGLDDVNPSLLAGDEGVAQVVGPDGTIVASTPTGKVALLAPDELAAARLATVRTDRRGFRVRADPVDDYVVVVGELLEDRAEALDALLAQLLIALPLALLVSSVIGYLVAGAALRPVDEMRRRAGEISAETAERRLPLPRANDEVRRLGETLNEMLDRLDAGLERERRFVADASHELRTPLALLKAELELALRQPRTPAELEGALRSASEETDRLVALAEDLLLVAQADQGKLPVRVSRVPVTTILDSTAARFERRAGDASRRIETSGSSELQLEADPLRMGQALGNLVDNSLRYGAGTIRVAAEERDDAVEIHVTDEGAGFPAALLPNAFERFSRADDARTSRGTGLGLAIVAAIASAHGGTAAAANVAGGGAHVWITIPKRLNDDHAAGGDRPGVA